MVPREPEAKATTPMMTVAWVTGSVLISKANFISRGRQAGGKIAKDLIKVWKKRSCERKESRDGVNGKSYGNSTSMVLGQGLITSGEEVSISLQLPLY
jgi:hypothetical protein